MDLCEHKWFEEELGEPCPWCRIEELEATIETQQQYLDNKDSVIKGMNEMIRKLERG